MSGDAVQITVNGRTLEAPKGARLLDVLEQNGIRVPTLCDDPRLTPYGGCRLCLVVRRDGRGGLVPACSTPVQRGMQVETETPEVAAARRQQLQLLLLDHRMECPACERNGECRLQELVYRYGLPEQPVPFQRVSRPCDTGSPVIMRDPEKCVLCGRCVRLCEEVQGVAEIGLVNRGLESRVATLLDRPLSCELCGQCVNACPVGALVARPYRSEVPSWLRTPVTTTCSLCSCGCQVTVETAEGRIERVTSRVEDQPNRGKLCAKGWLGWDVVGSPERLTRPLVRRDGRLQEVDWEEALTAVVKALADARGAGKAIVGVGSARLACEDAYLFQRLLREVVGTPHVELGPVGGSEALVEGMGAVTGTPSSSATLDDVAASDVVLMLRADPTRTHPLVKTEIVQGVRQRGQTLILAQALSAQLGRHAAFDLKLNPASEEALLAGLAALLLASGAGAELAETDGFEEWKASLEPFTPAVVEKCTGVTAERLEGLAARLADARSVTAVVATGLGIPGDEAGVVRAAAALVALLGPAGRGVLVLGETANVQGAVDVGLWPTLLPGHRSADEAEAWSDQAFGVVAPAAAGWPLAEAFARATRGEVGVLWLTGQDPVGVWPRGMRPRAAVRGAGSVIVQDAFLTATARLADVVLPVAILGERSGSLVGADGIRRTLQPVLTAPDGVPQDGQIFREVARRLDGTLPGDGQCAAELTTVVGWPRRAGGPIRLAPVAPPAADAWSGVLLDAAPSLFHSGAVTTRSRLLQQLAPTVAVHMHPADARASGLVNGETVRVTCGERELLLRLRLDHAVQRGSVLAPWHSSGDSAAALLVEDDQPTAVEVRRSL